MIRATPAVGVFAAVMAATGLAAPRALAEQRVEMLLSWHAPYGLNRSSDSLVRDCNGSGGADTLYLSYRLAEDAPLFSGLTGLLIVHPQLGDSLGPTWATEEQKPPFLKVEFPQDTAGTFRAGWNGPGIGDWRYYHDTRQGAAKGVVRLIFAVPSMNAGPIRGGQVYSLARIIVERPQGARCRSALCFEWMESKVAFSVNAVDLPADQVRASFTAVNSPGGLACASYRLLADQRAGQKRLEKEARLEAIRKSSSATSDTSRRR